MPYLLVALAGLFAGSQIDDYVESTGKRPNDFYPLTDFTPDFSTVIKGVIVIGGAYFVKKKLIDAM